MEILVLPPLHTPPVKGSLNVIVRPEQTDDGPDIVPADGNGFTVIVFIAVADPHEAVVTT